MPSRRSARRGSTICVIVSFFACVYQLPLNGSTTAYIVFRFNSRTRNDSPMCR